MDSRKNNLFAYLLLVCGCILFPTSEACLGEGESCRSPSSSECCGGLYCDFAGRRRLYGGYIVPEYWKLQCKPMSPRSQCFIPSDCPYRDGLGRSCIVIGGLGHCDYDYLYAKSAPEGIVDDDVLTNVYDQSENELKSTDYLLGKGFLIGIVLEMIFVLF